MATFSIPGYGSVDYWEMTGSPRESVSQNNAVATRTLQCDWGLRWLVAQYLLGSCEVRGTGADKWVSRKIPHGYRGVYRPDEKLWLYANSISGIVGRGRRGEAGSSQKHPVDEIHEYHRAELSVVYEQLTYPVRDDSDLLESNRVDEWKLQRYVTKTYQPGAEFITLPVGCFRWATGPSGPRPGKEASIVSGSYGKLVSFTEINYIWHQVPAIGNQGIPTAAFTHIGKVNDAQFDIYNPGTLLLTAVETRPYKLVGGVLVFDITYKMKYFEPETGKGHNHFLQYRGYGSTVNDLPEPYTYELITHNGNTTGQRVYEAADFRKLFTPV